MRFPGSEKENYIGLDIGSSAIKICQLIQRRKGLALKSFGIAPLPPLSIIHGVIQNAYGVADVVKSLIEHLQIKSPKVVFALSGYSVFIKKITLPALSEKDLSQSIQYEAQQHVPFEVKDVNLDFHVLGPLREDPDSMNVLLAAVKKETLSAFLEVIDLAGLEAVIADIAAFALANAYENLYDPGSGPVALLNLGANQTTLEILGQEGPAFIRDIFIGGQQLTEEIEAALSISFIEAERIKLGEGRSPDLLDKIAPGMLSVLLSWLEEIKKILDFLSASEPENKPNRIVLSGGCALMPDLPRFLSDGLHLPVELFNPFTQIAFEEKEFDSTYLKTMGPQAAIAFGLALRQKGA